MRYLFTAFISFLSLNSFAATILMVQSDDYRLEAVIKRNSDTSSGTILTADGCVGSFDFRSEVFYVIFEGRCEGQSFKADITQANLNSLMMGNAIDITLRIASDMTTDVQGVARLFTWGDEMEG